MPEIALFKISKQLRQLECQVLFLALHQFLKLGPTIVSEVVTYFLGQSQPKRVGLRVTLAQERIVTSNNIFIFLFSVLYLGWLHSLEA